MDTKAQLIEAADWDQIVPLLLDYADFLIRQHIWRGAKPTGSCNKAIALADGRDANDYVQESMRSILDPLSRRNWDVVKCPNILEYLKSTIKSMISNASTRIENRDTRRQYVAQGDSPNPIDLLASATALNRPPDLEICNQETLECQQDVFSKLKEDIKDDPNLSRLMEAYEAEITKPREIEAVTDIPASRVSELKRKLRQRLESISPALRPKNNRQGAS